MYLFRHPEHFRENIGPGCYGDTVGLLGAGAISQKLQELLTNFELNVIVMASRPERRTVSMEEVFRKAFVVSNHLPNRIDNQNVIREEHFLDHFFIFQKNSLHLKQANFSSLKRRSIFTSRKILREKLELHSASKKSLNIAKMVEKRFELPTSTFELPTSTHDLSYEKIRLADCHKIPIFF